MQNKPVYFALHSVCIIFVPTYEGTPLHTGRALFLPYHYKRSRGFDYSLLLCRLRGRAELLQYGLFQMPDGSTFIEISMQGHRMYSRSLQSRYGEVCPRLVFAAASTHAFLRTTAAAGLYLAPVGAYS